MNTFQTINPFSESVLEEYSFFSEKEIRAAIERVHRAQASWKKATFPTRSDLLVRLGNKLRAEETTLARLITTEMGKPIRQSREEIKKCAGLCDYYAQHGETFLKDQFIPTEAKNSYITFQPIGIVFAIMPWNFPFWQVFRSVVPTILAGNGAILKHSPNTTGCALKIEQLFQEAGFPHSIFRTLLVDIPQIEVIIGHPLINGITLTGSTQAGRSVAALSGKYLKKTVLELGGSDPYLIFEDANLELAIEKCVEGRLLNTGQSCIAAKRFLVTEKNSGPFLAGLISKIEKKVMGDPIDENTDLGPLARKDLVANLQNQVEHSVWEGAVIYNFKFPSFETGYFFKPVILSNVRGGTTSFREELFGPVASVILCKSEAEMIHLANQSNYGLGSAIFSEDIVRATKIASEELEAGCCFINDSVRSDTRLPFGGIKESGYGRELAMFGVREFVNIKTIYQN